MANPLDSIDETIAYRLSTNIDCNPSTPYNTEQMNILFSEGSSLTAREFLNALGPRGHRIEVLDPSPFCICSFSRWTKRLHKCPASGDDPIGYLETVNRLLADEDFDVLLPTHEQAWLFSAAESRLSKDANIAIAPPESFSRVQSKIEFARLLDEAGLPQPAWEIIDSAGALEKRQPPYYLKTPYSTAGTGVHLVTDKEEAQRVFLAFSEKAGNQPLMLQAIGDGRYGQVQALFDHGRLVAAHTSIQTAIGIGHSAAARMSVSHEFARKDVAAIGGALDWHGGLTLDYLFEDEAHVYIECNPRTVEPSNAVASGVDIPGLQLALSMGEHPAEVPPGRAGVHTRGALAMLLGKANFEGTRKAVLRQLGNFLFPKDGEYNSKESLTPVSEDLLSLIPLLIVVSSALFSPGSAVGLSKSTIARYAISSEAIDKICG